MNVTEIKERPILFSAPMVQAILEGRKTQTRRRTKRLDDFNEAPDLFDVIKGAGESFLFIHKQDGSAYAAKCPYGKPGDHLWIKETWQFFDRYSSRHECHSGPEDPKSLVKWAGDSEQGRAVVDYWERRLLFRADEPFPHIDWRVPWRPSIFMPRWASRITLEITDVRVERLNDISKADAIAEGISVLPLQSSHDPSAWYQSAPGVHQERTAQASYAALWESINGEGSWAKNDWVWVVSFKRVGQSR